MMEVLCYFVHLLNTTRNCFEQSKKVTKFANKYVLLKIYKI